MNGLRWSHAEDRPTKKAVAYYRHSAQDRQENSVEIQQDQVRRFAEEHGVEIIREFADRGKSGLSTEGRHGFNEMIHDYVQSSREDFDYVLVLDVSRWGRFQDVDLSDYYTGLCAFSGKRVVYTTHGFPKHDDLLYGLRLHIEKYMSANFSRELSEKVFKGCAKIASQGFRAGGTPPYAMRRLLLDESRHPVQVLEPGQRKSIQNQRVTLTPGGEKEVAVVERIFAAFVSGREAIKDIAAGLNGDGIPSPGGAEWSPGAVKSVLTNEFYVGTMVYNRTTKRLKTPSRPNPTGKWIRAEDAFPAIIAKEVAEKAREMIEAEEERLRILYSDEDMIEKLRRLYETHGTVRPSVIAADRRMVAPSTYARRFESLDGAYQEIFREVIEQRTAEVVAALGEMAAKVEEYEGFIVLDDYVSLHVQPRVPFPHGYEARWAFRPDPRPEVDLTLGVPLSNGGSFSVLGYLVFPRAMTFGKVIRLGSTSPERFRLHAYTLEEMVAKLIGLEGKA